MKKIFKDKNVVRIGNLQIMQQSLTTFWERQYAKKKLKLRLDEKNNPQQQFPENYY